MYDFFIFYFQININCKKCINRMYKCRNVLNVTIVLHRLMPNGKRA